MSSTLENPSFGLGFIALGIILLKVWHGWRLGIVRQAVSLGGLVVGSIAGYFGAPAGAGVLRPFVPLPDPALLFLGGVGVGLIVFLGVAGLGAILFKKTRDQGFAPVRIIFGLGGAVLGGIYGVVLVAALALGLRLLGLVAETMLAAEKNQHLTRRPAVPKAAAARFVALKNGIDTSVAGRALESVDPIPAEAYATLRKVALLAANARSMQRFIDYPGVRAAMDHPKIAALLSDPELSRTVAEGRYFAAMTHPKLVAAANDPEVAERLRAIDLEKALDHATAPRSREAGAPSR